MSLNWIVPPGLFRLSLAAAVVLSHISDLDIGRLAVMLFFYLSGYWTIKIWREKFRSSNVGHFYLARYLRIAPLFLIATLISAWLRGYHLALENFTLIGIGSSNNDPTGVSWSLDVELQFYFMLPAIALALRSTALSLFVAVACLAVGWWLDTAFEVTTALKYMPAFIMGSLTYHLRFTPDSRTALASIGAFVLMTALTAATPFISKSAADPLDQDLWALGWMTTLLPYVAASLGAKSSGLDRHLGNLSFPWYLAHFPIIALVNDAFGASMATKLSAVAFSIVVALVAYVLLDRPIDRWRVQVTEGRLRLTPQTPAAG